MKSLVLILGVILGSSVVAQTTFQWDTNDTIQTNLQLNYTEQYPTYQSVVGNDTVTLAIEIVHNDLPTSWDGMVCIYGTCMGSIPPVGTQATMDPIYGSNQGMIRLTVNPYNGTETAKLQVKVWDIDYPNDADTATFLLNTTVSTPEILASKVQIVPNPVQNTLTINAEIDLHAMQILDASGRVIREVTLHSPMQSMDVSELKEGWYTVRCSSDQGSFDKRFMKL